MIPQIFIEEWKAKAPWQSFEMIEQDLVISRALIDLYNNELIRDKLVFRGGTALNKIYINPAARYSEDIDFVQIKSEPIGNIINAIRESLFNWLGEPIRKVTTRSVKLIYKYENIGGSLSKLKLEINTTEHLNFLDLKSYDYSMDSNWYKGNTIISTYYLEELMATKLRALYQRRKGRDLFDLWLVLNKNLIDIDLTINIFAKYCEHNQEKISRIAFEKNLQDKKAHPDFKIDMKVLLRGDVKWDFNEAFDFVMKNIINKIPR